MGEVIEIMGKITYTLLILTAVVGLAKWKFRVAWLKPNYHFYLAIIAIVSATTHAILIVLD